MLNALFRSAFQRQSFANQTVSLTVDLGLPSQVNEEILNAAYAVADADDADVTVEDVINDIKEQLKFLRGDEDNETYNLVHKVEPNRVVLGLYDPVSGLIFFADGRHQTIGVANIEPKELKPEEPTEDYRVESRPAGSHADGDPRGFRRPLYTSKHPKPLAAIFHYGCDRRAAHQIERWIKFECNIRLERRG